MRILRFNEFLNENKIYSNVKQITDKLKGDETTENKVVIMGLFRDNVNFKGIDPLKITLDELNTRYEKLYKESLERLKISFKGNDDIVEPYLKAYCENIKKLKNEAKPFSYKDPEKTLIDVVNNNQLIKGNSNEKLITIDNIDEKDIVFENDEIVIIYIPTQQHAIKYGKGQSLCIANPSLHYFPVYRIEKKATIYYVLFKKRNADDNKKLCAILNYDNNKLGIADKTNSGDFAGSSYLYFEDVVYNLNELEGKEKYLKYVPLTDKEIKLNEIARIFIREDDITSEIEKICEEHGFNKKEFFTSYIIHNYIEQEQYKYFTDDMLEFYIETGKEVNYSYENDGHICFPHIPNKYTKRYIKNNYDYYIDLFTEYPISEDVDIYNFFKYYVDKYNVNNDDLINKYIKNHFLYKKQFINLDKKYKDIYFKINLMNIASNTLLVLNSNSKRYDNLLTIDIKTLKDILKNQKILNWLNCDDELDDYNYDTRYSEENYNINTDLIEIYDNIIEKSYRLDGMYNSRNINMLKAILLNTYNPNTLYQIFSYENHVGLKMALDNGLIKLIDVNIFKEVCFNFYDSDYEYIKMYDILLKYLDVGVLNHIHKNCKLGILKNITILDLFVYMNVDIKIIELFIEHGAIMNNPHLLNELPQDKRKKIESLLDQ